MGMLRGKQLLGHRIALDAIAILDTMLQLTDQQEDRDTRPAIMRSPTYLNLRAVKARKKQCPL
jgi:uncharacterized protein involved in exopolysaccharide biosynthesis